MHSLLIFSLIASLLFHIQTKPINLVEDHDSESGEAEYEGTDDNVAEDYQENDHDAELDNRDSRNNDHQDAPRRNYRLVDNENQYRQSATHLRPYRRDGYESISGCRSALNRGAIEDKITGPNLDDDAPSMVHYRQPNSFIENNEQEDTKRVADTANLKINRAQSSGYENQDKKQEFESLNTNEEGDLLFENNKDQINKEDSREAVDTHQQSHYLKQLYNTMPAVNRDLPEDKRYENLPMNMNRDRRQVLNTDTKENTESPNPTNKLENIDETVEDEESAIKRHVKKLSKQELQELLDTLSEDKRLLLKKIMENDVDNDPINKREITKKAGAVEENNYNENSQSDSNKIQGGNPNTDISTEASLLHDTTESSKKTMTSTETGEFLSNKNTEVSQKPENKAELTNNEDSKDSKPDANINADTSSLDSVNSSNGIGPNPQMVSKTENKREVNKKDVESIETLQFDSETPDRDYKQNEDLFDGLNEDSELHDCNNNKYKREAFFDESADFSDSIKSLEESFPNSNSFDESNLTSGSKMAPLVRVKRRNAESAMTKRAANVIADTNVPYFPSKGENEDEDSDEGGEFDEGFYDRASNYARSNNNNKPLFHPSKLDDRNFKQKQENHNLENDPMNLGSDTDNVMSGEEGVNDNLMYSSGSRNKRAEADEKNEIADDKSDKVSIDRCLRSTPLIENEEKTFGNNVNVPTYQDTDSFGPLPRNYEGDLGRYKRIRRVKQFSDGKKFEENVPSN